MFVGCITLMAACASASGTSAEPGAARVTLALTPIEASSSPTTSAATGVRPTGVRPTTATSATTAPRPTTASATTFPAPTSGPATSGPATSGPATTAVYIPKTFAAVTDLRSQPLRAVGRANGPDTERVQSRLIEIGFWLSAIDGQYGLATTQAVMAYQKYSGLKTSGAVDAATADSLTQAGFRASASATDGTLVEVDKRKQLLFLVDGGRTTWVFNTSTGSGKHYAEVNLNTGALEEADAITPDGLWKVNREHDAGWWEGDLGKIYRPKYFKGGIAIHGMNNVPNYPASHGCVRLSLPAMDYIWANGLIPRGTTVWVHGGG